MIRILRYGLIAILILGVAIATLWAALALWFRLPGPDSLRMLASAAFTLFGGLVILALFTRRRTRALVIFSLGLGVVLAWWSAIEPPLDGNWSPDVARQVTGEFDGDMLTLTNVRAFQWRSETDITENWVTRRYDLSQLVSLDMFLSYWAGPEMAHFILSFGFADGRYLAWSVEVRREIDGGFRPVADQFKTNTLVIVAAEETDVVGVRSNVRGEDVQLFRLATPPEVARALLRQYVRDANALAMRPQFYNSIATNCTTVVVGMIRAIGDPLPLDWRLLANGYLPDYAYDHGALDTTRPMSQLRSQAHIAERAKAHGLRPGFSQAIRVSVPRPDPG